MSALSLGSHASAWDVFLLFTIPIGGGIPAGVVLAQSRGVGWLTMTLLYLVSDILLAFLFEPFMIGVRYLGKRYAPVGKFFGTLRETTDKTIARFGATPGPFMLILIAFGVDPMTGRAAALARGHGFLAGWAIAITGDMLFYGVVAVSTICLNNVLGDGTTTAIIIMVLMMGVPALIRRWREKHADKTDKAV